MTNKALQELMSTYGNRIKCIKCSGCMVILNQKLSANTFTNDDIKLETIGGTDVIRYNQFDGVNNGYNTIVVPTAQVVEVIISENENDRIDLYRI
jgi:hypothetical protein